MILDYSTDPVNSRVCSSLSFPRDDDYARASAPHVPCQLERAQGVTPNSKNEHEKLDLERVTGEP